MNLRRWTDFLVLMAVWAGMIVLFGLLRDSFFSVSTLGSVANRIPALALVATGMTLVMVTGGIDLSVGSVLGFCGAVVGVLMADQQWGLPGALGASLVVGTLMGGLNGLVSVKLRLPSFIVTLGMLEIARGLAFLTTDSQTKYIGASVESLGAPIGGLVISPAFVIALLIVACGQVMLSHMTLGRHLIAIGANREAALISGVPVDRPRILAHALLGLLTGLAAVFNCSRLGSADPNAGVGFELSAIAAVVVGGTSLMGGRGSVVKSFLGVLIIATLEAGLVQIGASEPVKRVVTGAVIVAAVLADTWRRKV
ncbi:ABC transporter permease [Prosthecobacter dejongeii]|uniref:Ribose transport system permease protein n=1 Tax=Prosthecobacter dejongeii TaxID=48465 RepID=A0A7W7YM25_9BACT|nr:ABC transporter permease [Prosthecobacter dejongeii]MBB5038680.1 ribose transport system permease protein [Prosthecobacter dejongeii]